MLERLFVQNFAVIKELSLELGPGLTVLSGETGAGKSIIVDAFSLLVGGRTSPDMIRSGCERALVQGVFRANDANAANLLALHGLADEGELIITREITANRSTCRVNGQSVTQGLLRPTWNTACGHACQHEHQSLFSPAVHQQLIDRFAGARAAELLTSLAGEAKAYEECERGLKASPGDESERLRLLDLINHQLDEIDAAKLKPNEEDELKSERQTLLSFDRLRGAVERCHAELTGGGARSKAICDVVGRNAADLKEMRRLSPALESISSLLEQAGYLLQDAVQELSQLKESLYFDQGRLEEIEQRLEHLALLKRKYGRTLEAVLIFREEAKQSKERLHDAALRMAAFKQSMAEHERRYARLAGELSALRQEHGRELCRLAQENIRELGMNSGRLSIASTPHKGVMNPRGAESMELLFSANLGEEPRPLAKIASGGEISRVMLAFKAAFSKFDDISTLVFDEIDSGVGGKAALAVAEKIAAVSAHKQVLCVSHLAQIAALSDHHLYVRKEDSEGRTTVSVEHLFGQGRVRELARMLGGRETAAALEHAEELLVKSRTR
ncbi:MAG: DNA repair protein RecN [Firmicutes bacterium]|nr:DNA repair protein RecN [candidate division NPL-UPA2 bacterium]